MIDALTALRRIACAQKLTAKHEFNHMPRAQMVALAREACRAAGVSFSAKEAWRGVEAPKPKRPRKVKLTPRSLPVDITIIRSVRTQNGLNEYRPNETEAA